MSSKKPTELSLNIDNSYIPKHIAIIMDGNRRWAKLKNKPIIKGHQAGVAAFKRVVEYCTKYGIQVLSVFAFSTENWNRSKYEVATLMSLFKFYARKEREELLKNGIKFTLIGDREGIPTEVMKEFEKTESVTFKCKNLTVGLAVNYGGRKEIIYAFKNLLKKINEGVIEPDLIDEESINRCLFTNNLPDPDILIRTSGEIRLSNFLLWQTAFSELYFTDVLWPDFNETNFTEAIASYQNRCRRYGV